MWGPGVCVSGSSDSLTSAALQRVLNHSIPPSLPPPLSSITSGKKPSVSSLAYSPKDGIVKGNPY